MSEDRQENDEVEEQFSDYSKVTVRFLPIGSVKKLKRSVISVYGNQTFASLINYVKRQLNTENSLFCYINTSFAPQLNTQLIDLSECYAIEGILNVSYCDTVAFG